MRPKPRTQIIRNFLFALCKVKVRLYAYIHTYIHTMIIQPVLSLTKILDLSHSSHLVMGFTEQKLRQKFELVFLVVYELLVCWHHEVFTYEPRLSGLVSKSRIGERISQACISSTEHDNGGERVYIGISTGNWKQRLYNHKHSFSNPRLKNPIALSKYFWSLKDQELMFSYAENLSLSAWVS